jgi:hypothetical protein
MRKYQFFTVFRNNVKLLVRVQEENNEFVNNLQITLDADLKRLFFVFLERVVRRNDTQSAVMFFHRFFVYDKINVIEGKRKFIRLHKLLVLRNIIQQYSVSRGLVIREYFNRWVAVRSIDVKLFRLSGLIEKFKKEIPMYTNIKYCLFSRLKDKVYRDTNASEKGLMLFDTFYNIFLTRKYGVLKHLTNKLRKSWLDNTVTGCLKLFGLIITRMKLKRCLYHWVTQIREYMPLVTSVAIPPRKALLFYLIRNKFNTTCREVISDIYRYSYNNEKADGLTIHNNLYFYENNYNHRLLRMINGFYKIYKLKKEKKRFLVTLYNDNRNINGLRNYFLLWCYYNKNIQKERIKSYGSHKAAVKSVSVLDSGLLNRMRYTCFDMLKQISPAHKGDIKLLLNTLCKSYKRVINNHKECFLRALSISGTAEPHCAYDNLLNGLVLGIRTRICIFLKNMMLRADKHKHTYFKEFKTFYSQKLLFIKSKKSIPLFHGIHCIFKSRLSQALKNFKSKFYRKIHKSLNIDHSILSNTAMVIQTINSSLYKKAKNSKIIKAVRAFNNSKSRSNALACLSNKHLEKYFTLWKENMKQEKLALLGDNKAYSDINVKTLLTVRKR